MAVMATLTVGTVVAEIVAANDANAQNILLKYAKRIGVPDTATNQQRADAIVRSWVDLTVAGARAQDVADIAEAARLENEISMTF
jgi:hypothetical protein